MIPDGSEAKSIQEINAAQTRICSSAFAMRVATYELEKLITEGMTETDFETTRAYLGKFVSLLTDGQSRHLGYAMDSQYYQTDEFSNYVHDALNGLMLDEVNRVIRENLSTENMQYVFVAKDAENLRRNGPSRIHSGTPAS